MLGRPLSEQEEISLRVLQPSKDISPEQRREVLDGLKTYFARIDAKRKPVSEQEENEIINEALRSARPGYRPQVN